MTKNQLIETLSALGLTKYAANVYLSLLGKNSSTASEIAKLSGVPRQKVYDATEELALKGLCIILPGRVKKYLAVEPKLALNGVTKQIQKETLKKVDIANEISAILSPVYHQGRNNKNPLDYIEIIKDHYLVSMRYLELLETSDREVLAFSKPPYAVPLTETEVDIRALKRGVLQREIYEYKNEDRRKLFNILDRLSKTGQECRVIKKLPIKIVIFDSKYVILSLVDPSTTKLTLTSLVINHKEFALIMKKAFESYWQEAEDYKILAK